MNWEKHRVKPPSDFREEEAGALATLEYAGQENLNDISTIAKTMLCLPRHSVRGIPFASRYRFTMTQLQLAKEKLRSWLGKQRKRQQLTLFLNPVHILEKRYQRIIKEKQLRENGLRFQLYISDVSIFRSLLGLKVRQVLAP